MSGQHPTDVAGRPVGRCVESVRAALEELLAARIPSVLPEGDCPELLLPLVRTVNRLFAAAEELEAFVLPLAHGDLSSPPPSQNPLAAPLLELQRNLARLTRQAHDIAQGDYAQRVDFMGDFSAAFNSMVELLAAREERLKAETALRHEIEEELQRERDLLVASPLVTFRWDVGDEGRVLYVSPNVSVFGYEVEQFVSGRLPYAQIVHPDDLQWMSEDGKMKAHAGLDGWTQEYRILDRNGGVHWIRDHTHAVRDETGAVTYYEGYVIDVTAQKDAEATLRHREEQLRMLSLVDDLTGICNRRGLFALGEQLIRSARRRSAAVAVIVLDIDGLGEINERYGHRHGDDVLRDVALLLREGVRDSDVVGRLGDDSFVLIAEDVAGSADVLTRRLCERLDRLRGKGEAAYGVGVSMGAALWSPPDESGLQELIEQAAREAARPA